MTFLSEHLQQFFTYTAFANFTVGHVVMIIIGLIFITLAIVKEYEPMLLVPIGFGILIGNIPFYPGLKIGIYETGSVMNYLYFGVIQGVYPPLIFLGIGAMTDFSALISNPKLILIGAAAQLGIFGAYMAALGLGFEAVQAGAIAIIGGADGPTAIFLSSKLAPESYGSYCCFSLFLYGFGSGDSATYYAIIDIEKGTSDQNETSPRGFESGKDYFPYCRIIVDLFYCSIRASTAGDVVFRKSSERKYCYQTFGGYCQRSYD